MPKSTLRVIGCVRPFASVARDISVASLPLAGTCHRYRQRRHVIALSAGALGEAEQTLRRLQERQFEEDDVHDALASLEAEAAGALDARLDAAGYGRPRTDPKTVLDRLRASA